jgi:hypothetical protein
MASDHPDTVFECPYCGQDIYILRIKIDPPETAVMCCECERVWLEHEKVGPDGGDVIENVPAMRDVTLHQSDLHYIGIAHGVPWERIAPDYQRFLRGQSEKNA